MPNNDSIITLEYDTTSEELRFSESDILLELYEISVPGEGRPRTVRKSDLNSAITAINVAAASNAKKFTIRVFRSDRGVSQHDTTWAIQAGNEELEHAIGQNDNPGMTLSVKVKKKTPP